MKSFLTIWTGNLVSLFGSGMVRFAITIWLWQQTGKATSLAIVGLCYLLSYLLAAPLAGCVADRVNRKAMMIAAYVLGAFATLGGYLLVASASLTVSLLYAWICIGAVLDSFYNLAYLPATTLIVPKASYVKASGLQSFERSMTEALAPLSAGVLLPMIGFKGILVIDLLTFIVAIVAHAIIAVPATLHREYASAGARKNPLVEGVRYFWQRKGLLGVLLVGGGFSLIMGFVSSIFPAMILAKTSGSNMALATVQAAPGIGGIVGGILVGLWGGPKPRILSFLGGGALYFILNIGLTAIGHTSAVWVIAGFAGGVLYPVVMSSSLAIWQSKIESHFQGRIFALRSIVYVAPLLVGYFCSGFLADQVFEPAMANSALLSGAFGWIVGTGPGAGMALIFLLATVLGTAMHLAAWLIPAIRYVETDLPDHTYDRGDIAQTV